jgi:hypothetical protein
VAKAVSESRALSPSMVQIDSGELLERERNRALKNLGGEHTRYLDIAPCIIQPRIRS